MRIARRPEPDRLRDDLVEMIRHPMRLPVRCDATAQARYSNWCSRSAMWERDMLHTVLASAMVKIRLLLLRMYVPSWRGIRRTP